jgi:2',3'-cyclic-nucleotide 2'-phosphodiesterase (5'-nucleotidase family)
LDGVRENVRTKETNLGNLTTDAMKKASGADVAFSNGGGIRASIEIGEITKKDLVTVFPFGNYVVTKKVTGETLLQALEVGVASYPETLGAFPQVSGITFTIDASKPAGNRVSNVKINGTAIDLKAEYLLATNDFVDNPNLINVAVSRAVEKLIVVVSEGSEEWQGTNIGDLVRYIKYNNFEVIESQIYSVFDLLIVDILRSFWR